ncbi:MAG TPA: 3-methyl-2-oxobutanoate hydroxymethyltransferase [Verrucomicrobia bacterium]|nr:MAG: 3-methyl-2-oxobutanoate hydroxymethyltransferase [Lentisphaerae bacterium GWF2_57_35]HBA84017.1 3-methyl-2-oxobutanoate hydroxymethyltransferase [Verrucomicrobiota bacterium]
MQTPGKWTAPKLRALKGRQKIVTLTAYDCSTARLMDEVGIHVILVGDSLGMTVLGYETTLPVTMENMLHHAAAVSRGVTNALVVADMPFLSYQVSISQAVENAGRFIKEAGAGAVKIEGGSIRVDTIRALVENGIPVMGHIGLTPQSVHAFGGYKVQGRSADAAERLLADAKAIEQAGVFALVLEGIPADLAGRITAVVGVPTIGIGAGVACDGQVLVVNDMLGMFSEFTPKFVKRYAQLDETMRKAFQEYKDDVQQGRFPGPEHSY